MRTILITVFACALCACGMAPVKEQDIEFDLEASASLYHHLGAETFARWKSSLNFEDLKNTVQLYKAAYEIRPDDVNFQYSLYELRQYLARIAYKDDTERELLDFYERLHPLVQEKLAPPAHLSYSVLRHRQYSERELHDILLRALEQSPRNATVWESFSGFYHDTGHTSLALAAAHRAYQFDPTSARYAAHLGSLYSKRASDAPCEVELVAVNRQAAKYYAEAVKHEPKSSRYLRLSADQYEKVGLLPLAYTQAKKAYEKSPQDLPTALRLVRAQLLVGKFADAEKQLRTLLQTRANDIARDRWAYPYTFALLKLMQLSGAELNVAALPSGEFRDTQSEVVRFVALHHEWVASELPHTRADLRERFSKTTAVEQRILDAHGNNEALSESALLGLANNACERSDSYFALAVAQHLSGDNSAATASLKSVLKEKHSSSQAYLWAKVLLDRGVTVSLAVPSPP